MYGVILVLIAGSAFLLLLSVRNMNAQTLSAGDSFDSIIFDGRRRFYALHVPPSYDLTPTALVIVLHGGGGNARGAARMTGFSDVADRGGFVVVYPEGTGRLEGRSLTWNSGNCCGYALDNDVDDVGFIDALISKLGSQLNIDSGRVFATGISNGGMMSYRLGCELSDRIVGIAPVAGALNVECDPSQPVSVIAFHGTADQHVLYEGGVPLARFDPHSRVDKSVAYAIDFWTKIDRCSPSPERAQGGNVIVDSYSGCLNGTAVVLYTIEGGTHSWPGGQKGSAIGDEPSMEVSATEVMWRFFNAHPRPATLTGATNGMLAALFEVGDSIQTVASRGLSKRSFASGVVFL